MRRLKFYLMILCTILWVPAVVHGANGSLNLRASNIFLAQKISGVALKIGTGPGAHRGNSTRTLPLNLARTKPAQIYENPNRETIHFATLQSPIRQNLAARRAAWTQFYIQCLLLIWMAATVRTYQAGWPLQWPNRPPPFVHS